MTITSNDKIEEKYADYVMPIWDSSYVPVKEAKGTIIEDFNGEEYLDLFSGISVTNIGHGNDHFVERVEDQLNKLVHSCSYIHPNEPVARLAEKLEAITPGDLKKSFFTNSGTEAVEGAIKLARKYTGSIEIISLEMGFHGRTLGSLALTGKMNYKDGMGPVLNNTAQSSPPYHYRCSMCEGGPCNYQCADEINHVIDTHTTNDIAGVVVEPIMGEGGIIVPPEKWLSEVKTITRNRGALFILDEVQTGYGRTGELWASEHFELEPDILIHAKGIANGMPLGAFTSTDEIASAFNPGDHLSTFGGNPVGAAGALATITELENGVLSGVMEKGENLKNGLHELEKMYDYIGESRGIGLMRGLEIVNPDDIGPKRISHEPDPNKAKNIAKTLISDHSIIVGVGGFYKNVLRIQPPLTISREEINLAVDSIKDVCEKVG